MKLTKREKDLYKALEIGFCKGMAKTPNRVIESMNIGPCYLGSQHHLEVMVKEISKTLKKVRTK